MSDHVKRIEEVEKRIEKIREESARKDDVGKVRGEMKAVFVSPLFRLC
jgi:predicted Holliday junction resolvase-like endonuclease